MNKYCMLAALCIVTACWVGRAAAQDMPEGPGTYIASDRPESEAGPAKPTAPPAKPGKGAAATDENPFHSESPSNQAQTHVSTNGAACPMCGGACSTCDSCGSGSSCGSCSSCGSQDCGCGCGCGCESRWTVTADAIFLQRTAARDSSVLFSRTVKGDGAPDPATVLLTGRDLTFDYEAGVQLGLIYQLNCCWDVEFNYFQVDGWDSTATVPGVCFLFAGNNESERVRNADVRDASALYNAELNFRKHVNCWLTVLGGFRTIEFDDRYSTTAQSNFDRTTAPFHFEDSALNHLYGFQLGTEAKLYNPPCSRFSLDGIAKIGVYDNRIDQEALVKVDGANGTLLTADVDHAAFVGELGIKGKCQVTKHLAATAGYEMLLLNGIGLAPEQVSQNNFVDSITGVNTHGHIVVQGATLGLEAGW